MITNNPCNGERLIVKTRVWLILNEPWFSTLATKLVIRDGTDIGVDTMATDGTHLYYHPGFVQSIAPEELRGVVAHEVMHCAFLHMFRRGTRDMMGWNIATDLAINDLLVASGFRLPKGVLLVKAFGFPAGLSAEKYYALLQQQKQNGGQPKTDPNGKNGVGGCLDAPKTQPGDTEGKDKDGKGKNPTDAVNPGKPGKAGKPGNGTQPGNGKADVPVRTETDWIVDVIQAEKVASAAGKMPGGLGSELRKARECKTDYREVTQRFVERTMACDYAWTTPNRRMLSHGLVLPGVYRENLGDFVIGVDTSGSVSGEMLDQFSADIGYFIQTLRPSKVHVVYCDTRVHGADAFEPDGEPFQFRKNVARGGTYFKPVFEWVKEQGIEPKAMLYLTDLEPGDSPDEPDYPVLWCVPETCTVKTWEWGEVVEITMDGK